MSDFRDRMASVRWNGMARLNATRDTTQAEIERDIHSGAKKAGREISRVPSGRITTEKFIDGEWVRVRDL